MQQRTEVIRSRTNSPGPLPAPPVVYTTRTMTVYRTLHGPAGHEIPCTISYIDTGAGVSYCKARAFWGAELMTGLAVVNMGMATNLAQADAAARQSVVGFNFIYADTTGHIAYWHTGRTPLRVRGHDPRLPTPGDGSFDWRGYLDPQRWPSVVDPAQGYVVSWNNKPQLSWPDSGDGTLWGPQQRMGQPRALLAASGPLDQTGLWQIARRTGELDLHDTLGFRPFLTALAGRADLTPVERAAVAQVTAWDGTAFYPDGAERDSAGNETGRIRSPGYAGFADWFRALERRVGRGIFPPVTGNADAGAGVRAFTQTPGTTSPEFEFFDDYDGFLYDVLAGRTRSGTDYLGGASALDVSKAALDDAVALLSSGQGSDPARWRAAMPQITFTPTDVSSIPSIPWENRGTSGQAVDLGSGRPGGPVAPQAALAERGRSILPATGTGHNGRLEVGAALALMGLFVRRVRTRGGTPGPRRAQPDPSTERLRRC